MINMRCLPSEGLASPGKKEIQIFHVQAYKQLAFFLHFYNLSIVTRSSMLFPLPPPLMSITKSQLRCHNNKIILPQIHIYINPNLPGVGGGLSAPTTLYCA